MSGFKIQHCHASGPVDDEVYERDVFVFLTRHFENAHARRRLQFSFRTIIVLKRDRRGRHSQYILRLFVTHLQARDFASFCEPNAFHVAAPRENVRFAQ